MMESMVLARSADEADDAEGLRTGIVRQAFTTR